MSVSRTSVFPCVEVNLFLSLGRDAGFRDQGKILFYDAWCFLTGFMALVFRRFHMGLHFYPVLPRLCRSHWAFTLCRWTLIPFPMFNIPSMRAYIYYLALQAFHIYPNTGNTKKNSKYYLSPDGSLISLMKNMIRKRCRIRRNLYTKSLSRLLATP